MWFDDIEFLQDLKAIVTLDAYKQFIGTICREQGMTREEAIDHLISIELTRGDNQWIFRHK